MPPAPLDADRFTAAFARHGQTLWLIAVAWVGRTDAADLVQETARVAWQRRATCTDPHDLRPWLAQITRNLGANWRRRRRPEPCPPEDLPDPLAANGHDTPTPRWPTDAEQLGLSDELARALNQLPETTRACLLLHDVLDHSFPEIAAMLELPENTAASHARRARLALRAALQPTATAKPTNRR